MLISLTLICMNVIGLSYIDTVLVSIVKWYQFIGLKQCTFFSPFLLDRST